MTNNMNREQWLTKAIEILAAGIFKEAGAVVPNVRVSVGFPGGKGNKNKVIGQYWHAAATVDAVPQIFISPVLNTGFDAIDVLVHELVHACTPGTGHRAPFVALGKKVGLVGKATSMRAGPVLAEKLKAIVAAELGDYPHGAINLAMLERDKQKTALRKVECKDCGYLARVTLKWIESVGTPICPCNGCHMEAA